MRKMPQAACFIAVFLAASCGEADSAVFFLETFDGPTIDTVKWRTEDLVAGQRWCGSIPGSPTLPGSWIDPQVEGCRGPTTTPPYGIATLESGLVRLSTAAGSKAMAYLSSRLPGQPIFPAQGDFTFSIRMRYDQVAWCGDGVFLVRWDDTTPSGGNASVTPGEIIFQIWGDGPGSISLYTDLRGSYEQIPLNIPNQNAFHEYSVVYEAGAYTFLFDGQPVFGPVQSAVRPSAVWMGNPIFSYSGCVDWAAFSVDYISVEVPSVSVGFALKPNTFNLQSMGHWVTGFLEPSPPFLAADIDVPSIRLNGIVPVASDAPAAIGDHDANGVADLEVKFDRALVGSTLVEGDQVPVSVTGTLAGTAFTGSDTIRVIHAVVDEPPGGGPVAAGSSFNVRWTTPPGLQAESVALLSSLNNGQSWTLESQDLPNTGNCVWQVPNTITDEGQVAVVLVESSNATGDVVDGVLGVSGTFTIQGGVTGVASGENPTPQLLAAPNPTTGGATLAFVLQEQGPAHLAIYDLHGRLVKRMGVDPATAGRHSLFWDGCNQSGKPAGPGLYIARLEARGERSTAKIVKTTLNP